MKNVLIVGYGVVGQNLAKEIAALKPDVADKYKEGVTTKRSGLRYDVAFICVDTPRVCGKTPCDLSEVKHAIAETDAEIYVVKSTVLPGTIDALCKETGKRILFSPEYYGGTQHCNNYEFYFTILGGEREAAIEVQQLLQGVYDGRHAFRFTDAKTTELTKYMENSYLATVVSFCQQFYEVAEQIGVDYEELRECFLLDPRVSRSHTFVYRDRPYWQSHCLDKDVAAIAETYDCKLLQSVIDFNEAQKRKYKKQPND